MALALETPLRELPGIGETRSRALERLGLRTVGDLLHHYPRDYEDRTVRSTFRSAPEGEAVCVAAMVAEPPRLSRIRKGLELIKVKVVDAAGAATLTFFNQSYVKDALHTGETYVFYGKVEGPALRRTMTNPIFEREDRPRFTGRIGSGLTPPRYLHASDRIWLYCPYAPATWWIYGPKTIFSSQSAQQSTSSQT